MQFFYSEDKVTFDTLSRKLSIKNVHYFLNASHKHEQNVNGYLEILVLTDESSLTITISFYDQWLPYIKIIYVRIWYGIQKVYLICTTESPHL